MSTRGATTADFLLNELEEAAKDLLNKERHSDLCTNHHQMSMLPKVAPCKKCESVLKSREKRFLDALENLKLLRDVFGAVDA
jgi:hypothetical protein